MKTPGTRPLHAGLIALGGLLAGAVATWATTGQPPRPETLTCEVARAVLQSATCATFPPAPSGGMQSETQTTGAPDGALPPP